MYLFQYKLLQNNLPSGILVEGFEDRMVCRSYIVLRNTKF